MSNPLRREVIREAVRAGWSATLTRGSHVKLVHASGAIVICAGTSGDCRAIRHVRAELRRQLRRQARGISAPGGRRGV
jgi:predicted RNA binding protein YcfA (HicA-like mRNA interferase family)